MSNERQCVLSVIFNANHSFNNLLFSNREAIPIIVIRAEPFLLHQFFGSLANDRIQLWHCFAEPQRLVLFHEDLFGLITEVLIVRTDLEKNVLSRYGILVEPVPLSQQLSVLFGRHLTEHLKLGVDYSDLECPEAVLLAKERDKIRP